MKQLCEVYNFERECWLGVQELKDNMKMDISFIPDENRILDVV